MIVVNIKNRPAFYLLPVNNEVLVVEENHNPLDYLNLLEQELKKHFQEKELNLYVLNRNLQTTELKFKNGKIESNLKEVN